MSNNYITTQKLIDNLEAAGYQAILSTDICGTYVRVHDDRQFIGGARVDRVRVMNMTATNPAEDHERVLDLLYRYASTPLDERDEQLYIIGIRNTNLYITHTNGREVTATADKEAAKVYESDRAQKIFESLGKRGVTLFIEKILDATN